MALGRRFRPNGLRAMARPRKRARFAPRAARRPRRAAQRRFTRRAGWAVGRTSQSGAVRRTGYNTRRLRLSTYRNKLWETTRFKTHWRSAFSDSVVRTTPGNADNVTVNYSPAWGGNVVAGGTVQPFWTTSGGRREITGVAEPFGDFVDLTIRGGRYYRRYTNTSENTIRLERWEVYRKPEVPVDPAESFIFFESLGWDPTYIADFQTRWRIGRKFVNDLEPGDTFTIEQKIPIAKIDQDIWNGGGQRAWTITAISSATPSQTLAVQSWHSVSFVGDRVDDNP